MQQDNMVRGSAKGFFSPGMILGILVITALSTVFISILPATSIADGTIYILMAAGFFFLILCIGVGTAVIQKLDTRRMILRLALTVWCVLLVDEVVFSRVNTSFGMGTGQFSIYAYAEGAMWLVCMAVLLVLTTRRPQYIPQLFKDSAKWVTLFVSLCLLSITWAPGPLYAMAWGFKLVLVVSLLQLCSSLIEDIGDITLFLKVTAVAFVFLTVLPVYYATSDPDGFFFEGRLNADPDLLSPLAASLLLISMMLYAITKKRYWVLSGTVAAFVMLLAFGKAGVIGGFLGVALFMLLQRKVVRSLGLLLALGGLAMVLISVTPLGNYLETYRGGSTLTGRTVIWGYAITAMHQNPILGKGYLGTYFSWENTSGLAAGAVHLHNGFLEVAYNNGILGELLLLMIHFIMVRNILSSMRTSKALRTLRPLDEQARYGYILTVGCLALYIHTFIQGVFGGHFGGRCMSPYMLWLALFMISAATRRVNERMLSRATATRERPYAEADFGPLTLEPVQN